MLGRLFPLLVPAANPRGSRHHREPPVPVQLRSTQCLDEVMAERLAARRGLAAAQIAAALRLLASAAGDRLPAIGIVATVPAAGARNNGRHVPRSSRRIAVRRMRKCCL